MSKRQLLTKQERQAIMLSHDRAMSTREAVNNFGGNEALLDAIASGREMVEIAHDCGVSLINLNHYIKTVFEPTDIEAAKSAAFEVRFSSLNDETLDIAPEKGARFKAKFELTKYLADKQTHSFKERKEESKAAQVVIAIDWAGIMQGKPQSIAPIIDVKAKQVEP